MRAMWDLLERVRRSVSDATFGTIIVIVHVAMAERSRSRKSGHIDAMAKRDAHEVDDRPRGQLVHDVMSMRLHRSSRNE